MAPAMVPVPAMVPAPAMAPATAMVPAPAPAPASAPAGAPSPASAGAPSQDTAMAVANISEKSLHVAVLDDDGYDSSIFVMALNEISNTFGQPYKPHVFYKQELNTFLEAAQHSDMLFLDPGAVGIEGIFGKRKTRLISDPDRVLYNWLIEHPSKNLYVRFALPRDFYRGVLFLTADNVKAIDLSLFQWEMSCIVEEWLFNNNPLALFSERWLNLQDIPGYVKKLKAPVLQAVAKQLGVLIGSAKGMKADIISFYHRKWEEDMTRRGVKGFCWDPK